ncbi:glutathione S-transferase family protein [Alteraurantiacibacter buctensis]|uniref:Glutathione S-transferase family protein n=1 Tax=Alteraurantiacibacter buctensis TaxID=1503981 RepID=A0A844YY42_9SPHN|nr:glutathione S-transferase family protein [Alteraurantiacibacter buctensis]MXO71928.1 glutathione S-transferase family protein [Alteraurantiacibacter buctensis]
MAETVLYFAPQTCARVPLVALEEAGVDFTVHTVAFMAGEHRQPDYLARNPKGKVPALAIDGLVLTENVAIADYLAERHPEAALLPPASTPAARAERLADLAFCAATLHPIVTRIRMAPFIAGPASAKAVYDAACQAMDPNFAMIEARLAQRTWWYGEWSVMDAYLNWAFFRVAGARYDVSRFPAFARHDELMQERPSYRRAMLRERQSEADLVARGLLFTPPDPATFS